MKIKSKVRDENGNLRVVYHGTGADFTVFDKSKVGQNYSDRGGDLGFYVSPCIVFRDGGMRKRRKRKFCGKAKKENLGTIAVPRFSSKQNQRLLN